jgi:hypothetical protein
LPVDCPDATYHGRVSGAEGSTTERPPQAWGAIASGIAGLFGLLLIAAVPESPFHPVLPSGVQAVAPLRWIVGMLGLASLSRDALAGVAIVVMVLAGGAFVWVVAEAWRGRISLSTALWVGVVFNLAMLAVPLLLSRDVYSYAIYGKISGVYHQNPYVSVPADFPNDPLLALTGPKWNDTPAVYGPMFSMLSAGITRALQGVVAQVIAFRVLAIASSLALLFVVASLVRRVRPERAAFAVVMLGWNPVVLFHSVASGHNDVMVALSVAAGLALLYRKRPGWAAVVLALGMSVKITAGVPLFFLVVVATMQTPAGRRLREFARLAGISAGVWIIFAIPFLQTSDPTLGMANLAGHEGWLAPSRFFRWVSGNWLKAAGMDTLATIVGSAIRIAFPLTLVAVIVALVRYAWRHRDRLDPGEQAGIWAWALLVLMLTGPVLLPWYIMWVLPLAFALTRVPRRSVIILSVLLAFSEVVTEPMRSPRIYEAMLLSVHYVITIGVFAVLVWLVVDLRRRILAGDPLSDVPAPREGVTTEADG